MHSSHFRTRVLAVVAAIPSGQVMTYKAVAEAAGNPHAARAVGAIMKTNFNSAIPCHRVVRSDGTAGGYNRGVVLKQQRLLAEGVVLK